MLVMLSNNNGIRVGHLAGKYPGQIGHLYSPGGQRGPYDFMPFALDNGAFAAFTHKTEWPLEPWLHLLDWAKLSGQRPKWVLVPDVVADRKATIARWMQYSPVAARYGWPLAFAVQDGMDYRDVPVAASVVFVGGSTEWKWRTLPDWCARVKRVHVGRVNTYRRLKFADQCGAESCDGTGWTRGDQRQWRGLCAFLDGRQSTQDEMDFEATACSLPHSAP